MQNMNRQLNLPQIQKILHDFEKQSEIMDMKEEMINDAIDDAMEANITSTFDGILDPKNFGKRLSVF